MFLIFFDLCKYLFKYTFKAKYNYKKNNEHFQRKLNKVMIYYARTSRNKKIDNALEKIPKITNLKGSLNLQFKIFSKNISIFEINPRLSSTVMIRHMLGFKDCHFVKEGKNKSVHHPRMKY